MAIPEFNERGFLPVGVHVATVNEVSAKFGSGSPRRSWLMMRVSRWVRNATSIHDGSFVTAKLEPHDVDAVIWLPNNFDEQLATGSVAALELYEMITQRHPEELFAVTTLREWREWSDFFMRTREVASSAKALSRF